MASNLNVTNNCKQTIRVMPYLTAKWVVADIFTDIALIIGSAVTLNAAAGTVIAGELPAEITTLADIYKYLNLSRQVGMGMISTVTRPQAAAKSFIQAFNKNTIPIAPGTTVDVRSQGTLAQIFSPSGISGILGAQTMDLIIMTEDNLKLADFTSVPDATWVVRDNGITMPGSTAIQHQWDGEATTTSRLGMTTFDGYIWIAGRRSDSKIWCVSMENDGMWMPHQFVGSSGDGPSLSSYQGTLYIVFRGKDNDQSFWMANRVGHPDANGDYWGTPVKIPGLNSFVGPMLAEFNNKLFAVFRGPDNNQGIFYATYSNQVWTTPIQIPNTGSSIGPSIVVFQNKLYALWRGAGKDNGLYYASFDGTTWSKQTLILYAGGSSVGPSVAVFNGRLYAAWRGSASNEGIWYGSFDGNSWDPQRQLPGVGSSVGPALCADQNNLYLTWRGAGPDDTVWWTKFNGSTWLPQLRVSALNSVMES